MHRMNDGLETHFLSSTFLQPVSHTQTLICQSRRWLTPTQTNPDIRVILITQATFLILYTNLIYTWFDLNTKHIWINSVEFRLNLKSISLTFVSNTVRMLCKILNTNKYKKNKTKKKQNLENYIFILNLMLAGCFKNTGTGKHTSAGSGSRWSIYLLTELISNTGVTLIQDQ